MEEVESCSKRTRFLSDTSSPEPSDNEVGFSKYGGCGLLASTVTYLRWYSASISQTHYLKLKPDAGKKVLRCKREWSFTNPSDKYMKKPHNGLDFTVMSYNILSQKNLLDSLHLYSHCDDEVLDWEYRKRNLLSEIEQHNADIICLQELEESAFNDSFNPRLESLGYTGLFKRKTGDHLDGCALFFKKKIFDLEQQVAVEFKQMRVPVLDRDNVALVAMLKPRDLDRQLVVATTHLLFNPRRGDVKLSQLRLLLAEIDKLSFIDYSDKYHPHHHPTILCGDMNSEPFSPLYNFITCGSIFLRGMKAGTISGQPHGQNKGRVLKEEDLTLLPLGINNESKYNEIDALRQKPLIWKHSTVSNIGACASNIKQNIDEAEGAKGGTSKFPIDSSTGVGTGLKFFSHKLNFLSAYTHFSCDGTAEVTTHNNNSCATVDYIFYNVNRKYSFVTKEIPNHKSVVLGPLHLLGTYDLPRRNDLEDIGGLPNAYLSSDHVCLISRFLLTSK